MLCYVEPYEAAEYRFLHERYGLRPRLCLEFRPLKQLQRYAILSVDLPTVVPCPTGRHLSIRGLVSKDESHSPRHHQCRPTYLFTYIPQVIVVIFEASDTRWLQ